MSKTFEELILAIQKEEYSRIVAMEIDLFVEDELKRKKLSLYEAYILNGISLNLRRNSLTEITWKRTPRIYECIAFVNQILLAVLFDEIEYSEKLKNRAREVYSLYVKKRSHYVMDNFEMYIDATNNEKLLKEISYTRARTGILLKQSWSGKSLTKEELAELHRYEEPLLSDVFPYKFFEPENLLLSKETFNYEKKLSKEVENLILKIAMKQNNNYTINE